MVCALVKHSQRLSLKSLQPKGLINSSPVSVEKNFKASADEVEKANGVKPVIQGIYWITCRLNARLCYVSSNCGFRCEYQVLEFVCLRVASLNTYLLTLRYYGNSTYSSLCRLLSGGGYNVVDINGSQHSLDRFTVSFCMEFKMMPDSGIKEKGTCRNSKHNTCKTVCNN